MNHKDKKKKGGNEGGAGNWALSYGDLMTLLLTFFILIVSFSSVELDKVRQFLSSLRGASGILGEYDGSSVVDQVSKSQDAVDMEQELLEEVIEGQEEERNVQISKDNGIELQRTADGIMVRISAPILFTPGDNRLHPKTYDVLRKIAFYIKKFDCLVRIEGHTDDAPIRSDRYPTNWDLSAARAIQVLRFFQENCDVPAKRLEAIGYGSSRPLVPNSSLENRIKNRRVEIYLDWTYRTGKDLVEGRLQNNL